MSLFINSVMFSYSINAKKAARKSLAEAAVVVVSSKREFLNCNIVVKILKQNVDLQSAEIP